MSPDGTGDDLQVHPVPVAACRNRTAGPRQPGRPGSRCRPGRRRRARPSSRPGPPCAASAPRPPAGPRPRSRTARLSWCRLRTRPPARRMSRLYAGRPRTSRACRAGFSFRQGDHRPGTPQATPARTDAVGPDATGPAAFGLCTAYAHAKAHGTASQKAVAFRDLAAAAGGAAKIAAYCAAVPHPGSSQPGQPASARPARPATPPRTPPGSHRRIPPRTRPAGPPPRLPRTRPSRLAPRDPPRAGTGGAGGMARRAAPPTSRQPAAPPPNRRGPHTQPAAPAPLLLQIHALAASVLSATAADAWGRHGRPADSDNVLRDHQARQVRPGWP